LAFGVIDFCFLLSQFQHLKNALGFFRQHIAQSGVAPPFRLMLDAVFLAEILNRNDDVGTHGRTEDGRRKTVRNRMTEDRE